ncbi:alpha-2-antiplasmin [Pseudophryne corroboree]|uniref:alpha-2-antiplasmin n=1 Tax=Pseudophryne corroboree TaxID=495146 RepID=UPI003081C97F
MDTAVFCIIVLAGVCCSSAEVNMKELRGSATPIDTTTSRTTTPANSPDSTSDSWSDLHPWAVWATELEKTTKSTAPLIQSTETATTVTPETKAHSTEEFQDDKDMSSSSESHCDEDLSQAEMQELATAVMAFSKDLLKQVHLESNTPNVVVSPLSIALGLLQLSLGAENETERKLLETLHVGSLPCLHEKLHKVTKRLMQTALSVAARIYVRKDFHIKKNFKKRSEKLYGSKPVNLGQNKRHNLDSINKWVSDATKGKIPNFLSNIPADVVLMLLNAIHFKGVWKNKFDPSKTSQDIFYVNENETVLVDMMYASKYPLSYFVLEKLDSQVARLPFKGNTSFVVVMPMQMNWNLSKILDNLNKTELYSRLHKVKPTSLRVPKLNLNFKLELSHVLSILGLGQLFTSPNLKGISDEALFVSSVEHQSTLELNEEGVEAAAATSVVTSRSFSTFSINRPFLFFLNDDITGLPLFLGYVREPIPVSPQQKKEPPFTLDYKLLSESIIPK